jgi:FkbM family methyltransferase
MRTIYNPRGWIRPILRSAILHIGRLCVSPEYRFLQRLNGMNCVTPRYKPGQVVFKNSKIRFGDAASLVSAWDEIFVNRIYDLGELEGEDCYIVDAGSNIGLGVLYWTLRYPNSHGVALEPDPSICGLLRANAIDWKANFEVIEAAAGKADGRATFFVEGGDSGHLADATGRGEGIEVSVRRLSPLLDRPVSLLKIDIEGAEYEVIEEIRFSLRNVRRIFVECHAYQGRAQHYGSLLKVLQEEGFYCQSHATWQHLQPFTTQCKCPGQLDFSLNVFGTRF